MTMADGSAESVTVRSRRSVAHAIRTLEDGYGLTLILTVLTIFSLAAGGVGSLGGLVGVVLAGSTLLFALSTSRARPRVLRSAQVLVGISIAASAVTFFFGDIRLAGAAMGLIGFVIAAIVPFVIIGHIVRSPTITYRLVIGALVVYLLIGLCFGYAFGLIAYGTGEPFFVQTTSPDTATYLYFSYTTLSTVGYGDFTAAQELGRMIAISEAISGQLYLVSIVAILVANVGRSFRAVSEE
jgi:hypothetical protein